MGKALVRAILNFKILNFLNLSCRYKEELKGSDRGGTVVIFLENGAGAILGGNSRIPFDTKLIVTTRGTHGVNGYYIKI